MSKATNKSMRWLICGGVFVAVIAASGCGGGATRGTHTYRSPAAVKSMEKVSPPTPEPNRPAETASTAPKFENPNEISIGSTADQVTDRSTPSVNQFGELNGVPQPVRQIGEAGFQQHTYLDEGYDANVAVSPDGKWIAYASTRHSEHPDIYLQHVDGQSVTQLTADDADDAYPTFSPDGKQIAFCSARNGSWDIFLMDINGQSVTQVTSGPAQDLHPSFSPDGKRIVYSSMGSRSQQWELWTVSLITGEKKMIGFGLFPSWSPDKSCDRIAFQRARQRGSRWFSLWTLDLIDGEARRVTEVAVSSNAAIVAPSWSPDGKKLAFGTIVDPTKLINGKPQGQQDIWTINADGTGKRRVSDGNGANLSPFWAIDGRVYFVSNRGGAECVWSAQADTKSEGVITATDQKELVH